MDLIDPVISGNKWYKLRHNLEQARQQGHTRLLSFGGAWSNHLYAMAAAGQRFGFETIGVLRGELVKPFNPVLEFVTQQGMQLHPVSRAAYRLKNDPDFIEQLKSRFGNFYLIPEGGCNPEGVRGCAGLAALFDQAPQRRIIALACGTGTTLAGLVAGFAQWSPSERPDLIGVPVLKGGEYLYEEIRRLLRVSGSDNPGNWHLETEFHCGGYARSSPQLLESMDEFHATTSIPLEPVYTGKLFHALRAMALDGRFAPGTEVIALHTGGLNTTFCGKFSHVKVS